MDKKIAELVLTDTWDKDLVKALEKAGYTVILEFDGMTEKRYIIAEKMKED